MVQHNIFNIIYTLKTKIKYHYISCKVQVIRVIVVPVILVILNLAVQVILVLFVLVALVGVVLVVLVIPCDLSFSESRTYMMRYGFEQDIMD